LRERVVDRAEALEKLKRIEGHDLHKLAHQFSVTVISANGKVNKGWAGHVCERYLGLPLNSAQSPNFGSWELKTIPIKRNKNGQLAFKETMAITMIDPVHVANNPFAESHLLTKLKKAVIVARIVGNNFSEPTFVHTVTAIDLVGKLYSPVETDYELIRECLRDPARGFSHLTGKMGKYIQPRTKGQGHGSISRAFYARPLFLSQFISLNER